ncbi:MAG TPA: cytochrome c oxidase subunit II [Thermoflexales bacterium]|nr:cytochrome c oxidase subunit II [Thermoflexales bacterium]HQW35656.1 cytochrome c oxidase subunit II [Thermoflexales bacterium]HQX75731.1 cytochrome c oxidase subunit II [Thermoflexales bacterium]HQZ21223.1 cytochrome c oxidase subunit II [Thermoflexales bacterium]HQZ99343.1 cytochrome c oxidase subunit II [Thermoflexales bacterium]
MLVPPATQDTANINQLFVIIYILSAIVFVIVEGLLVVTAIRFRRRPGNDAMPIQVHGNNTAELAWTVIPALLIASIFALSVSTYNKLIANGSDNNLVPHVHAIGDTRTQQRVERAQQVDLVIKVTGRQWFWQFTYPDPNVTLDSNNGGAVIVPAGRNVRLDMTSADVVHAWWTPALGTMIYVNPGEMSYVWFNTQPGEYWGQCNAFCGVAHAKMLSLVKVIPADEWDKWYKGQQDANANKPLQPGDPERGKTAFLTGPCVACHTIAGTAAQGKVAPREMTKFAAYPTIAQVDGFAVNHDNLVKWLTNPPAVKPGTAMPNLTLKKQEIEDLAAYLLTLK